MVKHYEGMFLTHNKEARKDTDYLAEHVTALVEKAGGKVEQMVKWDERKLAYPIKGVTHGVYHLTSLTGDSDFDAKLRAEVRLSGLVLRNMLITKESLPEKLETFTEMQNRILAAAEGGESSDGAPAGAPSGAPAAATPAASATPAAAAPTSAPAASAPASPEPSAETPAAEPPKTEGDE